MPATGLGSQSRWRSRLDQIFRYTGVSRITEHISATGVSADDINASFTLSSAYLVFFMHCGFAMVRTRAYPLSFGLPGVSMVQPC